MNALPSRVVTSNERKTEGYEESLLEYGEHLEQRTDCSVQYEFPGEIRLQTILLRMRLSFDGESVVVGGGC